MQQAAPRRIYRRIKRDDGASKATASSPQPQTLTSSGRQDAPQPAVQATAALDYNSEAEARQAAARWHHMGGQSAPHLIWRLHPGGTLQAQVQRANRAQPAGPDTELSSRSAHPTLPAEEASSRSRSKSKKRSAPITVINTPQMLQHLPREGSSQNSIDTKAQVMSEKMSAICLTAVTQTTLQRLMWLMSLHPSSMLMGSRMALRGRAGKPTLCHLQHAFIGKQMLGMVDGFARAPVRVAAAAGHLDFV